MGSYGRIVLNYYDVSLREGDVMTLADGAWMNDNVIAFWFEYMERQIYRDVAIDMMLMSPQVVQLLKSGLANESNTDDVASILESMNLDVKNLIILPINDCPVQMDPDSVGGTHWSILVFDRAIGGFEHLDSMPGSSNREDAERIACLIAPYVYGTTELTEDHKDVVELPVVTQSNSYDCGAHVVANADALARRCFRNDTRSISMIANHTFISRTRSMLRQLIESHRVLPQDSLLTQTEPLFLSAPFRRDNI